MIQTIYVLAAALLATPALATSSCPTKSDAMASGIRITFDDDTVSHYSVLSDGKVIEDSFNPRHDMRYESYESVFFLRYGPLKDGAMVSKEIDTAHYSTPLASLPAMTHNVRWKGHVTYTKKGNPSWETDMMVSASPYPDLRIGNCSYKANLLTIVETDGEGPYVTYLAFVPELGFGIRVGSLVQNYLDKTTPVSIETIRDD